MKTLVLIDSHALIHRCFHALPPFTTPQGKPIGAVYGTATIILRMLREIKPDYIAACFDLAEPTFRHQEYKEYKAKRAKTPEDLTPQFEAIRRLYDAFGIKYFEKGGFEADDVIGSLTKKFSGQVDKIIIVTGDLDTLQLIDNEKIMVYTMKRGVQETMIYGEKAVVERFGLSPKQMVDFKGLKGDPSDNIPGVFGIGEKGAIKILQKFSNLENLYQEIEKPDFQSTKEFNEKLLIKLREQKEQAFFSKYLASIRTDLEFDVSLPDLAFNELNQEKIIPLFKEWRFDSLINRLRGSQASLPEANPNSAPIAAPSDLKYLIDEIKNGDEIIIFKEADVLAILWKEKIFIANCNQNDLEKLAPILASEKIAKVGYDFKEIYKTLASFNISLNGLKHDVKIAAWLLNSGSKDYSLEKIWQKSFQAPPLIQPPVFFIIKIKEFQQQKIQEWGLTNVFENIEMPLIPILAKKGNRRR